MASYDVSIGPLSTLFSLTGKVAVVTGGSRGLGLSGAAGLLKAGCAKVYITSRKADACAEACRLLNALPDKAPGAQAIPIAADGVSVAEIDRLVAAVRETTDHVDILFANAGATWGAPVEQHEEKHWDRVMDLNVKSVFFCVQRFLPLLTARATTESPSRVVATASVAGIGLGATGAQSTPTYSASKAAVAHLMRHLAVDLGPKHVLCNSIAPGFFPSKMASGLIEMQGGREAIAKSHPNGRLGVPRDIAGILVFLCSDAALHVNGGQVQVDGAKVWARSEL